MLTALSEKFESEILLVLKKTQIANGRLKKNNLKLYE